MARALAILACLIFLVMILVVIGAGGAAFVGGDCGLYETATDRHQYSRCEQLGFDALDNAVNSIGR